MTSESLHEDAATLGPEAIDRHRAIASLMEELEAVDWYDQRAKATDDEELRAILVHNRDEEKEHAAMILEWLRRHDPALDAHLKNYLFRAGAIHEVGGAEAMAADGPIVWAPGVDGAVVLSQRGEDFELTVGQDFAIGYLDHDAERVRLYIEESFTFWLLSPQAAIPLAHKSK